MQKKAIHENTATGGIRARPLAIDFTDYEAIRNHYKLPQ